MYRIGLKIFIAATVFSSFISSVPAAENEAVSSTKVAAPPRFSQAAAITTSGYPNGVVFLDDSTLLVSLSGVADSVSRQTHAELDVFRKTSPRDYAKVQTLILNDALSGANDITLLPDRSTVVVALEANGIALVDVPALLSGRAKPVYISQDTGVAGTRAGSFQVVTTPDGKYAFVSNEYGKVSATANPGNVGVVELKKVNGQVTGRAIGFIPLIGSTAPGVAISKDGAHLYVTTEIVSAAEAGDLSGTNNPQLVSNSCVQSNPRVLQPNGALTVISVAAATNPANYYNRIIRNTVVSHEAAACSPVRVAVTSDGRATWVVARGSDELVEFDSNALISAPDKALRQVVGSNGSAPVGIKLFDRDRYLVVTNSDRFSTGVNANASVFDLSSNPPRLVQTIATDQFPRSVAFSRNNSTLAIANYSSKTIQILNGTSPQIIGPLN